MVARGCGDLTPTCDDQATGVLAPPQDLFIFLATTLERGLSNLTPC